MPEANGLPYLLLAYIILVLGDFISLFVECVENDITLGEVCDTLRGM
jgi:hypothetical protein